MSHNISQEAQYMKCAQNCVCEIPHTYLLACAKQSVSDLNRDACINQTESPLAGHGAQSYVDVRARVSGEAVRLVSMSKEHVPMHESHTTRQARGGMYTACLRSTSSARQHTGGPLRAAFLPRTKPSSSSTGRQQTRTRCSAAVCLRSMCTTCRSPRARYRSPAPGCWLSTCTHGGSGRRG